MSGPPPFDFYYIWHKLIINHTGIIWKIHNYVLAEADIITCPRLLQKCYPNSINAWQLREIKLIDYYFCSPTRFQNIGSTFERNNRIFLCFSFLFFFFFYHHEFLLSWRRKSPVKKKWFSNSPDIPLLYLNTFL